MNARDPSVFKSCIGIVCMSAIPDDPRVRRQGDLFHKHGWDVVAIGLPGARSAQPAWRAFAIGEAPLPGEATGLPAGAAAQAATEGALADLLDGHSPPPHSRSESRSLADSLWLKLPYKIRQTIKPPLRALYYHGAMRFLQRAIRVKDIVLAHLDRPSVEETYWKLNDSFAQLYDLARRHRADIWLANDWTALPIVQRLAAEQGVPYAYDTHELAVDEYAERLLWRLTQRPIIAGIERQGIAGAVLTSCVSQGIADRLHALYRLREKPLLIRNMPHYEAHALRPCGDAIEVLYHGVVNVGRGLEACIDSVALWRPEFRLTIRGPGPTDYLATLASRARKAKLSDRVTFAPPVPMIDLVREAARFDIGLFALPGHSQQNVHVLPNKFFEYTMAGLALCISDLPEMTALLRHYDLGKLIPTVTPEAIAAAINGFDRASINAYKAHALEAAKTLNWEAEADQLFAAIETVVLSRRSAGASSTHGTAAPSHA